VEYWESINWLECLGKGNCKWSCEVMVVGGLGECGEEVGGWVGGGGGVGG